MSVRERMVVHVPIVVFDPASQPRYVARCTCGQWLRRRTGYDTARAAWREHHARVNGATTAELRAHHDQTPHRAAAA